MGITSNVHSRDFTILEYAFDKLMFLCFENNDRILLGILFEIFGVGYCVIAWLGGY